MNGELKKHDSAVYKLLSKERERERDGLELIPSENYASPAVLEAMGSILTNKYAEGYPGKRYYGGNIWIDEVERLAQTRAMKLFGLDSEEYAVNVQPYSGSPANIAAYVALADFGDTIMGLALTQGGHLTHGHKVNFSGKAFKVVSYHVREKDELLDYEEIRRLAQETKPKIIVSGATAYPRIIDFKKFQDIAGEVGAIHMADISHIAGLIAAGVHPSPFPFTDVVTTTTHKTLRGPRGAVIFAKKEYAERIDRAVFPGIQGGPHEHIIAAKAVCFHEAMQPSFKKYAAQVVKNAKVLAAALMAHGFRLATDGTENHLILVDLTGKGTAGKEAQELLDAAGMTVNKNTVPRETRTPFDPSGIRLGTPAVTTRGMKEKAMEQIAAWMNEVLHARDTKTCARVKKEVTALARKFPVPGI